MWCVESSFDTCTRGRGPVGTGREDQAKRAIQHGVRRAWAVYMGMYVVCRPWGEGRAGGVTHSINYTTTRGSRVVVSGLPNGFSRCKSQAQMPGLALVSHGNLCSIRCTFHARMGSRVRSRRAKPRLLWARMTVHMQCSVYAPCRQVSGCRRRICTIAYENTRDWAGRRLELLRWPTPPQSRLG
ncbi:hypothetical protein LY78DRAFT_388091 [Colletotrichum sublineola]|nr:hypothetical protein LY78DRAFT_388091 [Colletotrichum sublineola]